MKPLQHAHITAHRFGGEWRDWIAIHDWIDRSKAIFPSMQHRMFLHSDFGERLAVRIHGEAIGAEDGTVIPTRNLFRDHQVEDLGRVVTLAASKSPTYSARSSTIGSTFVARRAGIQHANNPTRISSNAITMEVIRSVTVTP